MTLREEWEATDRMKLDQLGDKITPQARKKIEAAIAEKVPRPTAAESKQYHRRMAELGVT